jgi:dTMP kinase
MQITTVPRTIVKTWLSGVRLPLTAVEKVTGHTELDQAWAPTLLFETFEAKAKKTLGKVLRDDELVEESVLQQAKVAELRRAAELEAEAAELRAKADAELEERREQAEQRREQVEQQAQQREQQILAEKQAEQRRIDEETRRKQAAAARADALREKSVVAKERSAKTTRLAEEQAALKQRKEAVQAAGTATALDRALEAKKAQRNRK